MAIFFTSDTHFGHGGALGLYQRSFPSVVAMNEAIVERWNATVGPDDEVWHLGDFAIRQSQTVVEQLLGRLNGRKHLVTGNNDAAATIEASGWQSVQLPEPSRNRQRRDSVEVEFRVPDVAAVGARQYHPAALAPYIGTGAKP